MMMQCDIWTVIIIAAVASYAVNLKVNEVHKITKNIFHKCVRLMKNNSPVLCLLYHCEYYRVAAVLIPLRVIGRPNLCVE
jgi:hypothetical protein